MGPTAVGKTDFAIALRQHLPVDIVSVDSAMVYRHMDIGTAKPSAEELVQTPHALIDICDAASRYCVANFCADAHAEIARIVDAERIPLLVGGTMMYFKSLLQGLDEMPASDDRVRAAIAEEAAQRGWPAMHQQLQVIDPDYAASVHPNHSQRISRALEVYRLSGLKLSALQGSTSTPTLCDRYDVRQIALLPQERSVLHQRIAQRFQAMLAQGFVDEVAALRNRRDLHVDLPAMRAVGYRQLWHYLDGHGTYDDMVDKATAATRQLAKRQLTWLRAWPGLLRLPLSGDPTDKNIVQALNFLSKRRI
ncbi:MAG: tRNA (adenosine(37)-N6)-dimethylallyltransferase MiaA [Cellvibrionaceae bacterium]|nr:tRNA (adenosine(37)-N6)-dimethylallyltransferase MiaA [Cellvibrionaceae bacterium]